MGRRMGKTLKINLIGMPWPANILQCSRQTDAMQPGDELVITLADKDVKESLIQFLIAIPDLSFNVFNAGHGYTIKVRKKRDGFSGKTVT
jgi:TusA-related sulfurtransferase